ncbi:MAG: aspartate-semialdehyde dehydrogenase [Candidatus Eisenbacteria bacterium]
MAWRVGILGATGAVGRAFLRSLENATLEIEELRLFATARSAGTALTLRGREYRVEEVKPERLVGLDCVLCSAGASASREWAPRMIAAGAWVIDNSSQFRMDATVPLVVPEVNFDTIDLEGPRSLIANPNCSTIQLVVALKPLLDRFGLTRVFVSTYQSASGKGQIGIDALTEERAQGQTARAAFPRPLDQNVIPEAGTFLEDGWTTEEEKLLRESRKILGTPELIVHPTCVRVPVAVSHSESVYVELGRPASLEDLRATWRAAPGIVLSEEATDYATPREAAGRDPVFVGRVRLDRSTPRGLYFWVVADNLLKGAALNAVQIAARLQAHERVHGPRLLKARA